MIVFRKRLLFWLIKAYIKKLGKRIIIFFFLGLLCFFLLYLVFNSIVSKIPTSENESIGIAGAYNVDNMPPEILNKISSGLTKLDKDGTPIPNFASSWKIENGGKRYTFYLKKDIKFSDGSDLISENINYNFSDAKVSRPNKQTIVFDLKESYSPFLATVSRPIFKKGYVGIGEYKIKKIDLNGNFVESLTLSSTKIPFKNINYQFYPSSSSIKTAITLGEITRYSEFSEPSFKNISFSNFPNLKVTKKINYDQLVTLFYNTKDSELSDKKIRTALSYTIPNEFTYGKKALSLYPPTSWVYTDQYAKTQDNSHALILLKSISDINKNKKIKLKIKTLAKYKETASLIKDEWKKIGIEVEIETVDSLPSNFQVFLGNFYVPKDPDQYMLWHSDQDNNITGLKNLRVDKLLEDGRKTVNPDERKKIYFEFQKYLLDDAPASFLYFPYEYEVSRK